MEEALTEKTTQVIVMGIGLSWLAAAGNNETYFQKN